MKNLSTWPAAKCGRCSRSWTWWAGDVEVIVETESQVIRGDAGLESGEDEDFFSGLILKMLPLRSPT